MATNAFYDTPFVRLVMVHSQQKGPQLSTGIFHCRAGGGGVLTWDSRLWISET